MPAMDRYGGHHIEFMYNVVSVTHFMIPTNLNTTVRGGGFFYQMNGDQTCVGNSTIQPLVYSYRFVGYTQKS